MKTFPLNQQAWVHNLETDRDRDFIINGITNALKLFPA